jgi:hypothetical protein
MALKEENYKPLELKAYTWVFNKEKTVINDVYSLINILEKKNIICDKPEPNLTNLNFEELVIILRKFLRGDFTGKILDKVKNAVWKVAEKVNDSESSRLYLFIIGIYEILDYGKKSRPILLINSIKNITDFLIEANEESIQVLAPLFVNNHFRKLFQFAISEYWLNSLNVHMQDELSNYDGNKLANELFEKHKEKLINNKDMKFQDYLTERVVQIKLLQNLESEIQKQPDNQTNTAEFYRKKAFYILDWMPVLFKYCSSEVHGNTFMQAAICFQIAVSHEQNNEIKSSDEALSYDLYKAVIFKSKDMTPEKELNLLILIVKHLYNMKFKHEDIDEIHQFIVERILKISDAIPIFLAAKSNITNLPDEDKSLLILRKLLKSMIKYVDRPDNEIFNYEIEADAHIRIIYHAYEGSLNSWYSNDFRENFEEAKSLRVLLMKKLLSKKEWRFYDIDINLDYPWIAVNRDKNGFIIQEQKIPFHSSDETRYSSIDGVEFDIESGEINFSLKRWTNEDPSYNNLLSIYDIDELLHAEIAVAEFSLDPADPNMKMHPFYMMRFGPASLYGTQLFNSMLMTDYLLKFFTGNQEVQGHFPYNGRPISELIKRLPTNLKKIITDYTTSTSRGEIHRFWITTDALTTTTDNNIHKRPGVTRYAFDEIKMIVKTHKMIHDTNGKLIDDKNESDNERHWAFYFLPNSKYSDLEIIKNSFSKFSIIFFGSQNHFFFSEDGFFTDPYELVNSDHDIKRLAKEKREVTGKVISTLDNQRLLYRLTRKISNVTNKSHNFSPTYIFAQEFTIHYNEFAIYFPEFGRLRELSKATVLVRVMSSERAHTLSKIGEYLKILENVTSKSEREKQILELIAKHKKLIRSFDEIDFAMIPDNVEDKNRCFWVPANINHSYRTTSEGATYSRLIYGGVQIAPKINQLPSTSQNAQLLVTQAFSGQNQARVNPPKSTVQQNRAVGNAYRDHVKSYFEQMGYTVKTEQYKSTPFGGRFIDLELWKDGKCYGGIETKTGNSRYNPSQRAKDEYLRTVGDPPYRVNLMRKR